jgi:hypothetical protein
MENRNTVRHLNGNDVDQSPDFEYIENEEIRIRRNIPKSTRNYQHIFMVILNILFKIYSANSQSVTDERSVDPQHMTSIVYTENTFLFQFLIL